MKKFLRTILATCLLLCSVFTFVSCNESKKINDALGATFSSGYGSDLTVVITGTIDDGETEKQVDLKYGIVIDKINVAKTCVKTTVNGNSESESTYYTDGDYVYYDFNGSKYKISEFEYKKNNAWIQEEIRSGLLYPWGDYYLESGDYAEKDGALTYSRTWVDSTGSERHALSSAPRNVLIAAFFAYSSSFTSSTTTDFTYANLTATAKDGYVVGMTAAAVITAGELKGDLKMTLTVNNPGKAVSVTLPSGCTTWEELK